MSDGKVHAWLPTPVPSLAGSRGCGRGLVPGMLTREPSAALTRIRCKRAASCRYGRARAHDSKAWSHVWHVFMLATS